MNPGQSLGVWEAIDLLQQALNEHHPQWADFTWLDSDGELHSLAEYVWDVSHAQFINVNPKVLLVTSGVHFDWEVPADEDLRDSIGSVGVQLNDHYRDYFQNEDRQSEYSEVEDAANYALYAFFNYDRGSLQLWCETYIRLFDESPLIIPAYDR